ncbi:hypothetical protein EMCRGX_G023015 [Ephydatia muelleri]
MDDSNHTMDMPSMDMRTTFYIGKDMTILFSRWITENSGQLFGAMLVTFILGILYEGLRALREHIAGRIQFTSSTARYARLGARLTDNEITPIVSAKDPESPLSLRLKGGWSIGFYVVQALLQIIQVGLAYILMLAVMTYNGWIFMAVVFGTGFGYLAFSLRKSLRPHNPEWRE